MILLPRGNPVKEKLNPGRINLPEAFHKLGAGKFSGYLRFDGPGGTGILIFEGGRLISALLETARERLIAYDAIARIFELSLAGGVTLDIYKLSGELALSIHALLHGDMLFKRQELKLIDIKALLQKLKEDSLTGCLRIYTEERIALIFYREGNPLGFFHDGSTELETTADMSMSVARLPGAKVDVLNMKSSAESQLADLMGSADLPDIWERTRSAMANQRRSRQEEVFRSIEMREKERRQKALAFLRSAAEGHLGKIGPSLVEKEFDKVSPPGNGALAEGSLTEFYQNLGRSARLVAGPTTVNVMVEDMRRGMASLLASA